MPNLELENLLFGQKEAWAEQWKELATKASILLNRSSDGFLASTPFIPIMTFRTDTQKSSSGGFHCSKAQTSLIANNFHFLFFEKVLTRFHFHFKIFQGYTTFTLTIQHCWHWHLFQPQKLKALVNPQNSFVLGHSSQWGTTSAEDTLKRLIKLCRDLKSLL